MCGVEDGSFSGQTNPTIVTLLLLIKNYLKHQDQPSKTYKLSLLYSTYTIVPNQQLPFWTKLEHVIFKSWSKLHSTDLRYRLVIDYHRNWPIQEVFPFMFKMIWEGNMGIWSLNLEEDITITFVKERRKTFNVALQSLIAGNFVNEFNCSICQTIRVYFMPFSLAMFSNSLTESKIKLFPRRQPQPGLRLKVMELIA